jgi:hypothetical protein
LCNILDVEDDDAHDVVEIVGDAGGQLAHGCQAFLGLLVVLLFPLSRHIVDYQHPQVGCGRTAHRPGDDFEGERPHLHCMPALLCGRRIQQFGQGVVAQVGDVCVGILACQHGQDLSRHWVGKENAPVRLQKKYAHGGSIHDDLDAARLFLRLFEETQAIEGDTGHLGQGFEKFHLL